jgi:hypothetical protein
MIRANKKPPAWAEGFDSSDIRLLPLHKKEEAGGQRHCSSGYTPKQPSATLKGEAPGCSYFVYEALRVAHEEVAELPRIAGVQ